MDRETFNAIPIFIVGLPYLFYSAHFIYAAITGRAESKKLNQPQEASYLSRRNEEARSLSLRAHQLENMLLR